MCSKIKEYDFIFHIYIMENKNVCKCVLVLVIDVKHFILFYF
jgi:hypothetical protein